jgi:hypothetical protein
VSGLVRGFDSIEVEGFSARESKLTWNILSEVERCGLRIEVEMFWFVGLG